MATPRFKNYIKKEIKKKKTGRLNSNNLEAKKWPRAEATLPPHGCSIVYAGLDAIITYFSLISSISAGLFSSMDVLVLGFANLTTDGKLKGFGDFVSSSMEKDVAAKESLVIEWDVTNKMQLLPDFPHQSLKWELEFSAMVDEGLGLKKEKVGEASKINLVLNDM